MGEPLDRSGRFLAGPLTTFDKAFPTLENVIIEYTEGDVMVSKSGPPYKSRSNLRIEGGQMRCSNEHCRRGGYEFDFDVQDMIRQKLVTKRFRKSCGGDEGSPKGRRPGRRCLCGIEAMLTIVYKPETAPVRVTRNSELRRAELPACPACEFRPLLPATDGKLTCGIHIFERIDADKLRVLKAGSHWWPKLGETLGQGSRTVWLDYVPAASGSASSEIAEELKAFVVEDVPVLAGEAGKFEILIQDPGSRWKFEPLRADHIASICI